jgi:hypothetical protein
MRGVYSNIVQSGRVLVTSGFGLVANLSYQIYQCSFHPFGEPTVNELTALFMTNGTNLDRQLDLLFQSNLARREIHHE